MILDLAHQHLRWPRRDQVLNPPGFGPSVYARLADQKLGSALRRMADVHELHVGILAVDPVAKATEAPLAIVCEFDRPVNSQTLHETHRLAWSFCRSPLLITLEPHAIRSWTCCEPPQRGALPGLLPAEIPEASVDLKQDRTLASQAAQSLRWMDLVTGQFYRRHDKRFQRNQCADELLLDNLKEVRQKLTAQRLTSDTTHDLLARLIFIQFLCDRTDRSGKPALGAPELARLHQRGVLSVPYTDLASILQNYEDTYALFRTLNETFNGDLFPGKSATKREREAEWQAEMDRVKPRHLRTLSDFVSGKMEMRRGQRWLWREYAFDTIPLEFISSVYEEFVSKRGGRTGAHYTPSHIVDFMLDRVLPWDSDEWDLKVLDPACGSGIFLVKAYQRLIHRWRNAHPGEDPKAAILKQLLTRNLFGVDKDPHAVRVASFSMYLAMCDEIDPRHYWTQVQFPRLRGGRLIAADFFSEDHPGVRTEQDAEQYDLVVGNAPWGEKTEETPAKRWKSKHGWTTSDGSVGPLFLAKAACLTKPRGRVAMLQPAGLLFHDVRTARTLREKLFSRYKVDEVVNLSALRFGLFKGAVSPACIVSLRAMDPDGDPFLYESPKPALSSDDDYRVIIEPHDVHFIRSDEAAHDHHVWTALMWGSSRDLELIRRLCREQTIAQMDRTGALESSRGLQRGNCEFEYEPTRDRPILEQGRFPDGTFLHLNPSQLPKNQDVRFDRPRKESFGAFSPPQLIVKESWTIEEGRIRAVLNTSKKPEDGILCSNNYNSIHAPPQLADCIEAACLSYNSIVAVYYLFLTSYRLAAYRPSILVNQLRCIPIPEPQPGLLDGLSSFLDIDERVRGLFSLKPAEWSLIQDSVNITLADFKGSTSSPGRQPTKRGAEADLKAYARSFARVLRAGFGPDKRVCTTVFQETGDARLPVRLVAVHLGWPEAEEFRREPLPSGKLRSRLEELNEKFLATPAGRDGGIFYHRVARVYDTVRRRSVKVPTVYLVKPDRLRYWTRSAAMRDADEVAADLMSWRDGADLPSLMTAEHRIA